MSPRSGALIELLLSQGADVRASDRLGRTALHAAAKRIRRAAMLQVLIDEDVDVNTQDYNGQTALHVAAYRDKEGNARVLLENAADVDVRG